MLLFFDVRFDGCSQSRNTSFANSTFLISSNVQKVNMDYEKCYESSRRKYSIIRCFQEESSILTENLINRKTKEELSG